MKPKLLVVTSTFPRWDNDTDPPFVYALSKRLTKSFKVTIHTPYYPGAATKESFDGMAVHRFRYFFRPLNKLAGSTGILPTLKNKKVYFFVIPFFMAAQFFSLFWLVLFKRPDLIHAHWVIPQGLAAVLVGKIMRIPVVVTAHGGDVFGLRGKGFELIKRYVLEGASGVTAVSKALVSEITTFASDINLMHIIPMGVDSSLFHPGRFRQELRRKYEIEGPFLLYVGRLTEKKGVQYLLEAMPDVINRFGQAKLLVIGSGELADSLLQQKKELGLGNNVHFLASMPQVDLPSYYATADIFIGPSVRDSGGDTEGFGLTFVEAAMSGCIVIASDIGGITDIIIDKETGYLVPPEDSKKLAMCINNVLESTSVHQSITTHARQRCIEYFDWGCIAEKYTVFLKEVLRNSDLLPKN